MKMKRPFGVLFLVCVSTSLAAGPRAGSAQSETPHPANGSPHKTVQVDWQSKLEAIQVDLKRDPDSSFLHGEAAVVYDALGDFKSFDREIRTAMRLDPTNSMIYYMAYAIYKRRHLDQEATSALDTALKIDPGNPSGHYQKALMLERSKKLQEALGEYEIAKALLDRVKSNSDNLQNNAWTYVDGRGNPFDVNSEQSHITGDIDRVRLAMGSK
jgi:tetratricopeptide (TPR) repeat protein